MYFINLFASDYIGNWVLGDRQYSLSFKCPANAGRSVTTVGSWASAPFDLTGNDASGNSKDTLLIRYSLSTNPINHWVELSINIAGATAAATTATEIVEKLNADGTFSTYFVASENNNRVAIRQTQDITRFRFFIGPERAETVLRFNARAGVAELPSYFLKDVLGAQGGEKMLMALNPGNWAQPGDTIDGDVIYYAETPQGVRLGLDPTVIKEDWELLRGRSGIFTFKKQTVDDSDRVIEIIEYPAGAVAGDLAKKTTYSYTDTNKTPDKIAEVPYVLQDGDLVQP